MYSAWTSKGEKTLYPSACEINGSMRACLVVSSLLRLSLKRQTESAIC